MLKYTGIGSRETPPDIIDKMISIGSALASAGWVLRSGGADGADAAFERGCDLVSGQKEIFLPWKAFNKSTSPLHIIPDNAYLLGREIHPAWNNLSMGAKKLHARNTQQILGKDLNSPTDLVICWTKDGKIVGGTATAIKLATNNSIRVINLAIENINIDILISAYSTPSMGSV